MSVIKQIGHEMTVLPNPTFLDGSPLDATSGGVIVTDGPSGPEYYSLARADMVPSNGSGNKTVLGENGETHIPSHRVGRIVLKARNSQEPITLGAEQEGQRLDRFGRYAPQDEATQHAQKELLASMVESSTGVKRSPGILDAARSQAEFHQAFIDMICGMVEEAESKNPGELLSALAVFSQHDINDVGENTHPHVEFTVPRMAERNGNFDPVKWFLVAGLQGHTNISNLLAATKAQEAMEYLAPVLYAPTLSSPFPPGGEAGDATGTGAAAFEFTPDQLAHMEKNGISREELAEDHLGWRLILRMMGSPSAGTWTKSAPESVNEYLLDAHRALAKGDIPTIDRLFGWHTSRIRTVLDGSGSSTVETSFMDTMLANPDTAPTMLLFTSALFRRFERMAIDGQDPRDYVANMIGLRDESQSREKNLSTRLRKTAKMMLTVSREGNDARLHNGQTPLDILQRHLLREAYKAPEDSRLGEERKARLTRLFAGRAATQEFIRNWAKQNNNGVPSTEAYFAPGSVGAPAYYMLAQYKHLLYSGVSKEHAIRMVEMTAGRGLHNAVRKLRESKKTLAVPR